MERVLIFRQLFDHESYTYTYILADEASGEAVIIDPVDAMIERDLSVINQLGLTLKYTLETHVHADHVTASGHIRQRTGARSVASQNAQVPCVSEVVGQGDTLRFGAHTIEVRHTPGHTDGCVSYIVRDGDRTLAFTGDALLVRGCGRTDFQQGSAHTLYRSVHDQLFTLPEDTLVYPAHDYRGHTVTTIAEERAHNPRLKLGTDVETFAHIMANLNLSHPKWMDVAVPANLSCGLDTNAPDSVDTVPQGTPQATPRTQKES